MTTTLINKIHHLKYKDSYLTAEASDVWIADSGQEYGHYELTAMGRDQHGSHFDYVSEHDITFSKDDQYCYIGKDFDWLVKKINQNRQAKTGIVAIYGFDDETTPVNERIDGKVIQS